MSPPKPRHLLPWLLPILAGLAAAWLRYGLIEQPALAELCSAAQPPWWCPLRLTLVLGFLHGVYGYAALAVTALALWRRSATLAALAAACGAFALLLYNVDGGALALLLACLRLVHLQGAGSGLTPARSPVSAQP